ncbi:MAG: hypothetical protein DHS20C16_24340 [Phycisphaerae bacterium]|nr:MAG: hypothetical protein DHS20C16_24340 [Phycisphaerae bacterium]
MGRTGAPYTLPNGRGLVLPSVVYQNTTCMISVWAQRERIHGVEVSQLNLISKPRLTME